MIFKGARVMSRDTADIVRQDQATNFNMSKLSPGVAVDPEAVQKIAYQNMYLAVGVLNSEDYSKRDVARQRGEWLTLAEGYAKLAGVDEVTLYTMIN